MAANTPKLDPTAPFFAWVGAADLAVEKARAAFQEFNSKALLAQVQNRTHGAQTRAQQRAEARAEAVSDAVTDTFTEARDQMRARFDEVVTEFRNAPKWVATFDADRLTGQLRDLPHTTQARVTEVRDLLTQWEKRAAELRDGFRSDMRHTVEEQMAAYEELVVRGRGIITKLRDDSLSGDVELIREDAEPVRDVPEVVQEAAADVAAEAPVAPAAPVRKASAAKAPAAKKAARKSSTTAADKATGTKRPVAKDPLAPKPAKKAGSSKTAPVASPAAPGPADVAAAVEVAKDTPSDMLPTTD